MNDKSEPITLVKEYFANITREYHHLDNSSSLEDEGAPEVFSLHFGTIYAFTITAKNFLPSL